MISATLGVLSRYSHASGDSPLLHTFGFAHRGLSSAVEDMTPVDYGTVLFYYEPVG